MKTTRKILSKNNRFTRKKIKTPVYRAAIIPHAGTKYAGQARESVFSLMRDNKNQNSIKKIIYISAIHKSQDIKPGVYEFSKDSQFGKSPYLEKLQNNEHSFLWVEKELRKSFPSASILVITPVKIYKNNSIQKWIVNYMKTHKECLLFSTTDLTHHGSSYNNNTLQHPHRLKKQDTEEELIEQLVKQHLSPQKVKTLSKQDTLLCGPYSVSIFIDIMKELHMTGKVTDYYDSNFGEKKLNKYVILNTPMPNFVSYVSIAYGKGVRQNTLGHLDIMMAIGIVKSEIIKILHSKHYTVRLPFWSPFYKMNQGVFVGTSKGNKTNCSYGRYEVSNKNSTQFHLTDNSAEKIVEAAGDCVKDAKARWKMPYQIKDLDNLKYKIELLEPKKSWREYEGKDIKQHFKLDGKQGVFLTLKNKSGVFLNRSATYLPVVAKENKHWTVEEYMNNLSKKAGGISGEWKNGKIKLYSSTSYTWDPKSQKIIIE